MADTLSEAGVVPLVGLTVSHDPPLLVEADAVKLIPDPPPTERAWEDGDPPCWRPNAKELGVTVIPEVLSVTVKVTGMVSEPREVVKTTEPLCVPADNRCGLTETVMVAEVVPLVGLAESQLPPLPMLTVKRTPDSPVLRTESL